jgi:8-oxo-dGTP diphosphatase
MPKPWHFSLNQTLKNPTEPLKRAPARILQFYYFFVTRGKQVTDESTCNRYLRTGSACFAGAQTQMSLDITGRQSRARGTTMVAAARELQEETGLDAEDLLYLMELQMGNTKHHVYEASVLNIDQARPQNEIFDCVWHPLDAVQNLDTNDATLRIVQAFKRRL